VGGEHVDLQAVKEVEFVRGRGLFVFFRGEDLSFVVQVLRRSPILACLERVGFKPFTWPSWPGRVVYARRNDDIDWLP
jgi:hypothetical protein